MHTFLGKEEQYISLVTEVEYAGFICEGYIYILMCKALLFQPCLCLANTLVLIHYNYSIRMSTSADKVQKP